MTLIDRIPFGTALPDRFFSPSFGSGEDPAFVAQLFAMEAARNEIILYLTPTIRLAGIFPEGSDEAYFGFWETGNELDPNQRAFARLEADARQRGRRRIVGPINFNTFHRYRLRLNEPPSWGQFDQEPVNPTYHPVLLDQLGFRVKSRFESRLIRTENIPIAYDGKQQLLAGLSLLPFDIVPLNPDTWQQHEDELAELVHQVFRANPAYKPIPNAQFRLLYNRAFAEKLCPYTSVLFRDRSSGRLVALSFCLPNYQSLHLAPGNVPNFARDFPRLTRKVLLVKSVGVHPAFRNRGLMSYLGAYGMLRFQDLYDDVLFCLMRSDNFSLHFSNNLPYEAAHYALFEKDVPGVRFFLSLIGLY